MDGKNDPAIFRHPSFAIKGRVKRSTPFPTTRTPRRCPPPARARSGNTAPSTLLEDERSANRLPLRDGRVRIMRSHHARRSPARRAFLSSPVERTAHPKPQFLHDVGINLRRPHILVRPSNSCNVRMSVPLSSKCVAKLCRNTCGVARRSKPATCAASLMARYTPASLT